MDSKRVLVVADPVESFQPRYDSTLLLISEFLKRNYRVDYLSSSNFESRPLSFGLESLPVQQVLASHPGQNESYIVLGDKEKVEVGAYGIILQRKDPPIDELFIFIGKFFSNVPGQIVQINNPAETFLYSEHLLPSQFPGFSIPTRMFEGFEELGRFLSSQNPDLEFVLKPLNACSGNGIGFFKAVSPIAELVEYWQKWGPGIVLQPFESAIETIGDLRILVMNNKIVGSVLRKLAPGKRLANLHQGASFEAFAPTLRQREAIAQIAPLITARGIMLIGFDFIGEKLSEINITCPSAMVQINEVMGIQVEVAVIDEIEILVKERLSDVKSESTVDLKSR